ncbi:MAG TPA: DNA repair protein RecO [Gemmataceae bacterium]|nr:DNA repair protein RecO [Gemmataceae bacterium]
MSAEKATALVLRTTDWSESSRIATLWTREHGKVRVLAKGGRRLKSNFENALDLLTLCGIVFLRKSSGSLDLLTEAQVIQRFPRLRTDLAALYAAYYVAELLSDLTQEYDSHPLLFDEALDTLRELGGADIPEAPATGVRLARFEMVLLRELGYSPVLDHCGGCGGSVEETELAFSPSANGVLCRRCRGGHRDSRPLSPRTGRTLQDLAAPGDAWRRPWSPETRAEIRHLLGQYVTYLLGRRPRLLSYLGS